LFALIVFYASDLSITNGVNKAKKAVLLGLAPALSSNIIPGSKTLPERSTEAYLTHSYVTKEKRQVKNVFHFHWGK
jgi:hypothetical protein